jgi:prevent-host-death family protein
MCYMSDQSRPGLRVGVRELRQNLSVYLRRVKTGETLDVTEHGRAVARLTPLPPDTLSPLERLVAEGRARPARTKTRDLPPPLRLPGAPLTDLLRNMRDEDDR